MVTVFDPGVADENAYQKVFEEFKNLVCTYLFNLFYELAVKIFLGGFYVG